jgi:hypothetical protein
VAGWPPVLGARRRSTSEVIARPFPLPERFLEALGYMRTVAASESPAMRARLADLLRQQGIEDSQLPPTIGPRRFVMLHWEPSGDELAGVMASTVARGS